MTGFPYAYAILVSDGRVFRTMQAPALGRHRAAIETALSELLLDPPAAPAVVPDPKPPTPLAAVAPATTSMMTQREIAATSGYSGNACSDCGEFRMKRSGTCETCEACGGTSGGCS